MIEELNGDFSNGYEVLLRLPNGEHPPGRPR